MRYIAAEDVAKAKEMDLLTYLRNYEPQELVHVSGNTYCTGKLPSSAFWQKASTSSA